jgi:molybdopterin converting factor subunit 1
MNVAIRFFARARELAGQEIIRLDLASGTTVGALKRLLGSQFPALQGTLNHCVVAIGQAPARDEAVIVSGAEIAVLPPVSGG